jgi:hypothetical protein
MAEGSREASLLIAISYQALSRALRSGPDTRASDCTVLILFASFYLEATLNYIIEEMGQTTSMRKFFRPAHPGLHNKLAWIYNEHVARQRATTRNAMYNGNINSKLRRRFPGFAPLIRFRNDISHGQINRSAQSLKRARKLRRQAKHMVDELYSISTRAGYKIPRLKTYNDAIRYYRIL